MDISHVDTNYLSKKLLSEIHTKVSEKQSGVLDNKIEMNEKDKKLKDACADFESILLNFTFQSMKKTVPGDSIFGKSLGKDFYESMYFQHLATDIARGENSIGIGEALYKQLKSQNNM